MGNIIELHQVDKVYRGAVDTQVLYSVELAFEVGSFSSIVGQSGSGKTTLLNIMGTLDLPTRGQVIIDNQNTVEMKKDRLAELRNQIIGFVFQFHFLLPEFTAMENVLMPYWISNKTPSAEILERVDELFGLMGISGVKNNLATRMSGGQQQRTAIIRALLNNPKLVLADEPSGNLDSDNTESIYRIFRDINEKYGTTFIIVTHDRRIAEKTDRIVEIRDGRMVMDIKT
ncbi:MAG: ABC transporter ATP-binding protein [Dehalococcoidales bacterium]|nr:ABC transporter ATP-binding protein [Dehalococcoidales bacterium]